MSIIDEALEANCNYARNRDTTLGKHPAPKIVVVTCMDPRLSDLPVNLGLPQADIDVIRTDGSVVSRHPRARLYFRRGHGSPARSAANCAAHWCLKDSGRARYEFSLGQINVTLGSFVQT
jgi:hypothetical protein